MSSENLASNNLARHFPGGLKAFVAAMNTKAASLGMTNARFDDPTGLSTLNQASATDLWKMTLAAYQYDTLREYSTTHQHTVQFRNPRYALAYGNTNPLIASSRWDVSLSKTGYLLEAGRCLTMVTEVDGQPLAMILLNSLGSRSPLGDAGRVRRWLETGEPGTVAGAARDYERAASPPAGIQQHGTRHGLKSLPVNHATSAAVGYSVAPFAPVGRINCCRS